MEIKKIHYCWFGKKPLSNLAKKCIKSWKRFMPDYQIIRWDETNYDIKKFNFIKEAYKYKKYAFVSDCARFDILYKYGGLFLDVDVEMIKPLEVLIKNGSFMALETNYNILKKRDSTNNVLTINPGLGIYANLHDNLIYEILNVYKNLSFNVKKINSITSPLIVSSILSKKNIVFDDDLMKIEGFTVYPPSYFNPLGSMRYLGKLKLSKNTFAIHHYEASWKSEREKKWIDKTKIIKTKMNEDEFANYLKRVDTRILKSIYINGFLGFARNQFKKMLRINKKDKLFK